MLGARSAVGSAYQFLMTLRRQEVSGAAVRAVKERKMGARPVFAIKNAVGSAYAQEVTIFRQNSW